MLNTRAMAIKCAEEVVHKPFDKCTFIVAHIGGGISTRLYKNGINIDSVNDDEGGFTPERGGRVSAKELIKLCYSGEYTAAEMMAKFHTGGGLMAHLGTKDALEVERRIAEGDEYAAVVYEALAAGCLRVLRGEEELQDFGEIAASLNDRIRIAPGVEPGTVPAR